MKIMLVCIGLASLLAAGALDVTPAPVADDGCVRSDATYIGAKSCKKCHFPWFKSWKKTPMAKAFDILKPGGSAEAKAKYKLDPKKDYTKDATCLACHTTGYGKPGGYPALVEGKAWTEDETKRAALMEGVQCEACHGPGSETGKYKKDTPEYKKADLLKMGMIDPTEENCKTCHNEKSPTITADTKFDYKASIKDSKVVHKRKALKKKHD